MFCLSTYFFNFISKLLLRKKSDKKGSRKNVIVGNRCLASIGHGAKQRGSPKEFYLNKNVNVFHLLVVYSTIINTRFSSTNKSQATVD